MELNSTYFLPSSLHAGSKAMMFIDGENLAIQFEKVLGTEPVPHHVKFKQDVYVWSKYANAASHQNCEVVRRYYYSSVPGQTLNIAAASEELKDLGIQAPRLFHKQKGKRAKRVDVQLTTDMLTHAHRRNYDIAILVAGDEDYVPLVEAVQAEGKRVVVWFFAAGLSAALQAASDHAFDIGAIFFGDTNTMHLRFGPPAA